VSLPNNFAGCAVKALLVSIPIAYIVGIISTAFQVLIGIADRGFNLVEFLFYMFWLALMCSPLYFGFFWYKARRRRQAQLQAEDAIGQNLQQGHTTFYLADDGEVVFVEEQEDLSVSGDGIDLVQHADNPG
jgi:hypothetical protein